MHRTIRLPSALLGGLALLALLSGGEANAQKAPDKTRVFNLSVNSTLRLQMTPLKAGDPAPDIESVENERDAIARVQAIKGDTRTIQITGLQPGTTRLKLTSRADPPAKPIVENIEVIVQFDVALLRNLLQQAVPTAAVTPIPGAGNTIIMTGTVAHAEDIDVVLGIARSITGAAAGAAQIINAMRVGGVQQVQLDVVVARVARSELRRMAFGDLADNGGQHFLNVGTAGASGLTNAGLTTGNPLPLPSITNAVGNPNGASPNIFLAIFNQRQQVFFFLQALRDNDLAKLLAEPHLVTLSGRPAHFNSGGQQAVPTVSGFGGTAGVNFVEFGTNLDFLPIVLGNGKIYLEVAPSITALDPASGVVIPGGGLVPGRLQQAVRTSVMMEDGQTFCIGGLIQNRIEGSTTKLPVLGDIPFIGVMFSRKEYSEIEEELVVLVTPHLVDAMACDQVPKFLPGLETRSPDDFELFLEGILEAPRGQRAVNDGRRYVPAWKRHPSAACYPCTGGGPGNENPCPGTVRPGELPVPNGACTDITAGCLPGAGGCGCANGGCGQPMPMVPAGAPPMPMGQPVMGEGQTGTVEGAVGLVTPAASGGLETPQ
jgi:pilus assembly protein CpaC